MIPLLIQGQVAAINVQNENAEGGTVAWAHGHNRAAMTGREWELAIRLLPLAQQANHP